MPGFAKGPYVPPDTYVRTGMRFHVAVVFDALTRDRHLSGESPIRLSGLRYKTLNRLEGLKGLDRHLRLWNIAVHRCQEWDQSLPQLAFRQPLDDAVCTFPQRDRIRVVHQGPEQGS